MAIGLLYGMGSELARAYCSRFTVGVTIASVMTASDDQRSAVHVLSYVRPNQTPLERKYANPAARRSLCMGISLLLIPVLVMVLAPVVDALAARHDLVAGILAVMLIASWAGTSLGALVFGVIGYIKARQRNVRC